ncbi:MAG: chemotaxis protein CheA [Anaerolineales bacterium]|nr:chemotaxis protein CheA [Anaerolineales bacterium]
MQCDFYIFLTQAKKSTTQADAFLRIKAAKVSHLLDLVGELSLVAATVTHHPKLEALELDGFDIAVHNLELLIREIQDLTSGLRLVPVGSVFIRTQRQVRDLSQQTGKPVNLTMEGEDIEIDKVLLDQLSDPLMHLVRNAIDHGLESPAERLAAGKPEQGNLILAATQQGREIQLSVTDDGRGLNREKILAKARERGLIGQTEEPDEATVWRYIFHSGLSTAAEISNLSGRGVGMDVVQTTIQSLRGRITIDSQPNQGTRITLHIPLTLAFLDSMIMRSQNRLFAVSVDEVAEVAKPEAEQITRVSDDEMVRMHDHLIPVCRLQRFYGETGMQRPLPEQVLVIVHTSQGLLGLPVDEVVGQQQITMKSLQGPLKDIRGGAGCALLASGDIAIALDCEQLSQELQKPDKGPGFHLNGRIVVKPDRSPSL